MFSPKDYLEKILEKKKVEIATLKKSGISALQSQVDDISYSFSSFYEALSSPELSLISEFKKASPSKGLICSNFDIEKIASFYEKCGASAFSILTEVYYFLGKPDYLLKVKKKSKIPVLRKDFIIDPIQVYESKILGADAILLILDILSIKKAQELLNVAHDLNLEVLVEVHGEEALGKLKQLEGLKIVGINNRDLRTFHVDLDLGFNRLSQLKEMLSGDILFVSESGYTNSDELSKIQEAGFSAVLIGEGLVTHPEILNYFSGRL